MADTDTVAIVDTDRDELRRRIELAQGRFLRLARAADPQARGPRCSWTVQELVAHTLTVAHRYQAVCEGRDFRRAATPREVDVINQDEMEAALAPIPQLVDEIEALAPVMSAFFDANTGEQPQFDFHCGIKVSGVMAQTNWLGELLFHGEDIALAVKQPWVLDERDTMLILRGILEVAPAYLRADVPHDARLCVALRLPGARPYVMFIHDGVAEVRMRRPDDRPDAVLRAPGSTLTSMLYGRMGPLTGARRGLFVVGGRRPWRAMKLQSYFEVA